MESIEQHVKKFLEENETVTVVAAINTAIATSREIYKSSSFPSIEFENDDLQAIVKAQLSVGQSVQISSYKVEKRDEKMFLLKNSLLKNEYEKDDEKIAQILIQLYKKIQKKASEIAVDRTK